MEGHLAYFISETADELDLRDLSEAYASDERGEKEMMLKVLLYGYCCGDDPGLLGELLHFPPSLVLSQNPAVPVLYYMTYAKKAG